MSDPALALRTERLRLVALAARELAEDRPTWCYPAIAKAFKRLAPGDLDDDLLAATDAPEPDQTTKENAADETVTDHRQPQFDDLYL